MIDPIISREAQEVLFQKHFDASYDQLERVLRTSRSHLRALAHERMFGIGYDTYGDQTFWLTLEQIRKGQLEELSDAIVYGVAECFQMEGTNG